MDKFYKARTNAVPRILDVQVYIFAKFSAEDTQNICVALKEIFEPKKKVENDERWSN